MSDYGQYNEANEDQTMTDQDLNEAKAIVVAANNADQLSEAKAMITEAHEIVDALYDEGALEDVMDDTNNPLRDRVIEWCERSNDFRLEETCRNTTKREDKDMKEEAQREIERLSNDMMIALINSHCDHEPVDLDKMQGLADRHAAWLRTNGMEVDESHPGYLEEGGQDMREQASVRYDIDRAVERVRRCIRGETDTKDSLTEFELREEADNLCWLLREYFAMEDEA